jgi:hypothetical protein
MKRLTVLSLMIGLILVGCLTVPATSPPGSLFTATQTPRPIPTMTETSSTALTTASSSESTPIPLQATSTLSLDTSTPQPAVQETNIAPEITPTASSTITPPTTLVPKFDHIAMIILENKDYGAVIGNSKMPYFNMLAQKYVLLSKYYAVTHPSLPNYIALVSGGTQGITTDCDRCFVDAPNLADLMDANGLIWKSYEEDMPSACFLGNDFPYAQRHNPFIYFDSIRLDKTLCESGIVPLTQLDNDLSSNNLPNFSLIIPNVCNDAHDCSLGTADKWLKAMVEKLQSSPGFGDNSLTIILFDEASGHNYGTCCGLGKRAGGRVAALLISPLTKPGFTDSTAYSHYSMLKTILTAWNLPDLANTAQAQPITAPWK